jgi:hypothetical protein
MAAAEELGRFVEELHAARARSVDAAKAEPR